MSSRYASLNLQALLTEHTTLFAHPLVPELSFYQAKMVEPLWEALEQETGEHLEPPFWAFVWPGGLAVARYLLDHPQAVTGMTVLDVACGNGVVAIAAARVGAQVTANDIDPQAIALVQCHAQLHGVQVEGWAFDLLDTDPAQLPHQIITVGDAFYERKLTQRLWPWLKKAVASGKQVLIGDPGRNFLVEDGLHRLARYRVETTQEVESRLERDAGVFAMVPAL